MGLRDKIKNNKPRTELQSITTLIVGGYKVGKTRLWKEISELHYASTEETLLLAFEDGYETWELDNVVPLHAEGTDDTLWKVWDVFKKEIVPDLVKEAKEGRIIKLIGTDTADRAIDACTAWVIDNRNKKYGKSFVSLQDISDNTNENGWSALFEELKKPFDTLKNAGYGLFHIAWTKEKETTLYDGKKYNSVQMAMNNTGKKVFESQASLICCLHNDITVTDKNGNELAENIKDKKGREKASNFHETVTRMYFRPTEFIETAGGRYTDLPESIEFSAGGFLKVFEKAVLGQLKKSTQSVDELKVEEQEAREIKTQAIEVELNAEELMVEIDKIVATLNGDQKVEFGKGLKKNFDALGYKQLEGDEEKLNIALELVKKASVFVKK